MKNLRIFLVFCLSVILILPANAFTVVIDAGHGGKDPGAIGTTGKEKDLNLAVSLRLAEYFKQEAPDIDVYLTRSTDVFLTLQERADFVNKHNADLFICVHTNAAENKSVAGTETYTLGLHKQASNLAVAMRENSVITLEDDYQTKYQGFDPKSVESYIMFEFAQDQYMDRSIQFADQVQKQFKNTLNRQDKGVRQAGFWVLHKSACPSVLIEMGFITNKAEEQYLLSKKGQGEIAYAIFTAFKNYKTLIDRRKQVVEKDSVYGLQVGFTQKPAEKNVEKDTVPALPNDEKQPVYYVQIFTVKHELKKGDPTFKGETDCFYVKKGNLYKYMCGKETDYEKITALRETLRQKFPDCFVVAFLGDKQIKINDALNLQHIQKK